MQVSRAIDAPGEPVTFTARVKPIFSKTTPEGEIEFVNADSGVVYGGNVRYGAFEDFESSVSLTAGAGVLTTTTLQTGSLPIVAEYLTSDNFFSGKSLLGRRHRHFRHRGHRAAGRNRQTRITTGGNALWSESR